MSKLLIALLVIAVLTLVLLTVQFIFAYRDGKKNKTIPVKYSLLKAIPIVLGLLGFTMYFASWVEIPLAKDGISFFELISNSDVSISSDFIVFLLWPVLILSLCFGLMISAAGFQLIFRVSVKSLATLILELLIGSGATIIGFIICYHIKHIFDRPEGSPDLLGFNDLFSQIIKISVGIGPVIIVLIGFLYIGFIILQQFIHVKRQNPIAKPTDFDRMRELKKLVDEGVITEQEFESKKSEFLSGRI